MDVPPVTLLPVVRLMPAGMKKGPRGPFPLSRSETLLAQE